MVLFRSRYTSVRTTAEPAEGRLARFWSAVEGWVTSLGIGLGGIAFTAILVTAAFDGKPALAAALFLFAIPGIAFLNMANFFARLKAANPELYLIETRGRGFIRFVGWSSGYTLNMLHDSVVRLSQERSGAIPEGLRRYAVVTRHVNRIFAILVILFVLGIGIAFVAW